MGFRLSAWRAALLFVVLTAVVTWPQVWHPASVPEHFDAYFNMWRIAWVAHQLPADPRHLFDANIFFPLKNTFALSDAVLLQGLAAAPLIWLGVPVVFAYNLLVFGSFVLCGVGMFLLVRDLTGCAAAGVISGIVFAFAPFRFDHYFHLELLWAQWMPLALWMLHRTLASGRLSDGLWTGVFVALQGLSCVYYTVFFATVLVVFVPVLWLGGWRAVHRRALMALAAGAVLAAVVLVPYMLPYRGAREMVGERESRAAMVGFAVGPTHYLATMPDSLVYGRVTGEIGRHEKRLFTGFVAMLLAVVALWPPLDRRRVAYAVALVVAVDISFGHRGLLLRWLYDHVMVYRGLRVTGRIGHVVLMLTAVLAGFGASRVADRLRRGVPRWAAPALVVLGVAVTAEYLQRPLALISVQTSAGEAERWLRTQAPGVVAEFPLSTNPPWDLGIYESRVAYLSTFHWRPLINGYSGFWPGEYILRLADLKDFPSEPSLAVLRATGVRYLVLRERFYGRERYAAATGALDGRRDVTGYGPFADGAFAVRAYRVHRP